ncbi:methyltransferase regulatory domain-containing protein [soil metagenome]
MDWTAGYTSDVEYTPGFYKELSPHALNFVCVLNGIEPVNLDRPYNYFELGFGRGLTINLLAAANPNGNFYATDFNPAHVAGARALADEANLPNLTLLESNFAELAQGAMADLPQFDFITLHGIYTWVTEENRRHIVDFIDRYLKPGGIVYVSYNAMPGWSASLPLQRLLVDYGTAFLNRSDFQIAGAVTFAQQLSQAGALYFVANPGAQLRLEQLGSQNPNYLVHEYMHKHWQPLYHADVVREMANAKLNFVASSELGWSYPQLYLSQEKLTLINSMPDPSMRETLKDYCVNTNFRRDVFVRGARKISSARRNEWMRQAGVALAVQRENVTLTMNLPIGQVTCAPTLFGPVCDALAVRPHTLAELAALPQLRDIPFEDLIQCAALLAASSQAMLYATSSNVSDPSAALRMNAAIAKNLLYGNEYQALCSPLLGNGMSLDYLELLVYGLLLDHSENADIETLACAGWQRMQQQGRCMKRGNVALQDPRENEDELREQLPMLLRVNLLCWRQLGMI